MGITAIFVGLLFVPTAVIGLVAGAAIIGHSYQPRKRSGRRGIVPPPPPAPRSRLWVIVFLATLLAAGCELPHGPPREVKAPYQDGQMSPVMVGDVMWVRVGGEWQRVVGVDAEGDLITAAGK